MPCKVDGSCIFLEEGVDGCYCIIYFERPYVCRMYPFHVSTQSLGHGEEGLYVDESGLKLYIYIDATCNGVGYGGSVANMLPIVVALWKKVVRGQSS